MIGTVPCSVGSTAGPGLPRRGRARSARPCRPPAWESFDLLDAPSKEWIDLPQSGHWPHFGQPADCAGVLRTVLSETR